MRWLHQGDPSSGSCSMGSTKDYCCLHQALVQSAALPCTGHTFSWILKFLHAWGRAGVPGAVQGGAGEAAGELPQHLRQPRTAPLRHVRARCLQGTTLLFSMRLEDFNQCACNSLMFTLVHCALRCGCSECRTCAYMHCCQPYRIDHLSRCWHALEMGLMLTLCLCGGCRR